MTYTTVLIFDAIIFPIAFFVVFRNISKTQFNKTETLFAIPLIGLISGFLIYFSYTRTLVLLASVALYYCYFNYGTNC